MYITEQLELVATKELLLCYGSNQSSNHCSNIMEQAIGTVGLPPVHQIVFRGVQIECGYGVPSAVKLATVMWSGV